MDNHVTKERQQRRLLEKMAGVGLKAAPATKFTGKSLGRYEMDPKTGNLRKVKSKA